MSRYESKTRTYEKMSNKGLRAMSSREIVEEAIDTLKIGKRKSIYGKDTLEAFFTGGTKDQSLCREGLIDIQNGMEMMLKGLIEYYGESYIEEHYTNRNGAILEDLVRLHPEISELNNIFGILGDDVFSFTCYKCSKFPRYETFRTNKQFRDLAYIVIDSMVVYIDKHILENYN